MLDQIVDILYLSDEDEQLAQISDKETRIREKREKFSKAASDNFKKFVPLIASALGFYLTNKYLWKYFPSKIN
jgi:hypothetical protein